MNQVSGLQMQSPATGSVKQVMYLHNPCMRNELRSGLVTAKSLHLVSLAYI